VVRVTPPAEAANAAPNSAADIVAYDLRIVSGPRYNARAERTVATLTPANLATPHPLTGGLSLSGDTLSVKAYSRNRTGNETGSRAVVVVRP